MYCMPKKKWPILCRNLLYIWVTTSWTGGTLILYYSELRVGSATLAMRTIAANWLSFSLAAHFRNIFSSRGLSKDFLLPGFYTVANSGGVTISQKFASIQHQFTEQRAASQNVTMCSLQRFYQGGNEMDFLLTFHYSSCCRDYEDNLGIVTPYFFLTSFPTQRFYVFNNMIKIW